MGGLWGTRVHNWRTVAQLVFVVMGASACGSLSAEFPVGFFGVDTPEDARVLKEEGFDAVQSYQSAPERVLALAAETRRLGQTLLISPYKVAASTYAPREFRGSVWYLQDEPDVHGVTRDQLAVLDKKVHDWSATAKTAFVVGDGRKAGNYPDVADVIMVDWYPVPHLPLESAGDNVRLTAQAAGGRRVWAVLQAMDWRDFDQRDPKKKRIGRFPDAAEIRFMSYDAVVNGAQGIWYFAYSTAPGSNLSQTPELLLAVSLAARELRAMAPIFARGRPTPLPFDPPTKGWMARGWTYRGRDYLVLLNRTNDRQWKVPDEVLRPKWRPLFAPRRDPRDLLKIHQHSYYLRPYQVLVLESAFNPMRLLGR